MILNSLCELLKPQDLQLSTGGSGRDAIDHLSKEAFDLVLLDMQHRT